jgi:hypothetical protein
VVRWIARVWAVASVVLVLSFIIAGPSLPGKPVEWLGFLFFPTGVCFGIMLAWWREGPGGMIAVGSLAAFYMTHLITAGTLPPGWAWILFAAPGFLFLYCWYRSRPQR